MGQCFALFANLPQKIKTPTGLKFRIAQEVVYNLEICEGMKGRYDITNTEGFSYCSISTVSYCSISTGSSPREVSVLYKQELVSAFRVETSLCF